MLWCSMACGFAGPEPLLSAARVVSCWLLLVSKDSIRGMIGSASHEGNGASRRVLVWESGEG